MNRISFPLRQQMKGHGVADLQAVLQLLLDRGILLGGDEAARRELVATLQRERTESTFDHATRRLVRLFQEHRQLHATGDVDGPTAEALSEVLEEHTDSADDLPAEVRTYRVGGFVRFADGVPAAGMKVSAFDRDLRTEQLLGWSQTARDGSYRIEYSESQFRNGERGSADLVVKACDAEGEELLRSPIRFNAGREETIDLLLDVKQHPLSEYERLLVDIRPVLGDVQLAELEPADIDFLAGDTGLERERLAWLVESARHDTQVRERVAVPLDDRTLTAAAFYAWLRAGMPSDLDELIQPRVAALIGVLRQSIENHIVPASLNDHLELIQVVLTRVKAHALLKPAPAGARPSLGDLVGLLKGDEALSDDQAARLAVLEAERAPGDGRWQKAAEVLSASQIDSLQSVFALHLISDGDTALMRVAKEKLHRVDAGRGKTALRRVAAMEPQDWLAVLNQAGAPGDGPARERQARELALRTAELMPTDFLLARVARPPDGKRLEANLVGLAKLQVLNGQRILDRAFGELKTEGIPKGERANAGVAFADVQRLVNLHPGLKLEDVLSKAGRAADKVAEIQRRVALVESVYAQNAETEFLALDYLPGSDDLGPVKFAGLKQSEKGWVLDSLKAYQRVYRAAGNALLARQTLEAGFHSAAAVAGVTVEDFARTTSLSLAEASSIHAAAKDSALDAGLQFMAIRDAYLPTLWTETHPVAASGTNSSIRSYLRRLPGLEALFGRQSTCRCEHCSSVLSPAAYFVDLMNFVDKHVTSQVFKDSKVNHALKLQSRRPDLWTLELTCANTNDLVPTLDIINQILENAVAEEQNPRASQRAGIQKKVYKALAQADDSFQQPFVLPLRRVESYLRHFERTRDDVARALGVDAKTSARARLGLSVAEHDLIAPGQPVTNTFLTALYGGSITTGITANKEIDVQKFLALTHWTRDELGQLLKTEFVRHTNSITLQSTKASAASVQNDVEVVKGLDVPVLDRLHRFTRLWRKLGWSIAELDQALYHFRTGAVPELDTTQLENVAALVDLKARFDAPVDELCILVAGFPTQRFGQHRPLFDRLFNLEPFVTLDGPWSADPNAVNPNPTFAHPAFSGGTSQPSNRILQRLLAGLQVTDQELVYLMQELGLLSAANDVALSPDNLAILYRHARLARHLKLSVLQLLQLLNLAKSGAAAGPHRVGDLAQLQRLLRVYDQFQASGYGLDDLALITGEKPLKPDLYPDDKDVAAAIAESIRVARALEFDDTVFTQIDGVTEAESRAFVAANDDPVTGAFELVVESQRWRLRKAFDLANDLLAGSNVPKAKARLLLDSFHPRGLLPGRIAARLGLSAEKLSALGALAGDVLVQHDEHLRAELEPGVPDRPAPKLRAIVRKLLPLVTLFRSPAWDGPALQFVDAQPGVFGLAKPVDSGKLTRETAFKVASYARLATMSEPDFTPEKSPPDPAAVREVLETGVETAGLAAAEEQARIASIARALRVPNSRIAALHPHLKLASDPSEALGQLERALTLAEYLGVSGETLKMIVPSAPTPAALTAATEYDALVNAAEGLYGVIRAKYPDEQIFKQKVEAFEDQIRSLRRDGLVEYLIRSAGRDFKSPSDLHHHFLVDTQIEGCARTSRVVAANSNLQLYVHRILMNLEQSEPDDPNPIHVEPGRIGSEWAWRKNYRIWEANRKVFLYPENYIEPELRDDKTPLFETLEATLLQQPIDEEGVTAAYAAYLSGFDEVARLKIAGAYHDLDWWTKSDRLHLFGVTPADPPEYYYRSIENAHYGETEGHRRLLYSPWRKIELQIPVRKVAPVVHQGRLYVFWVAIATTPTSEIKGGESKFVGYHHKVSLQYTSARLDGTWTAPQTVALSEASIFPTGDGMVDDPLVEPSGTLPRGGKHRSVSPTQTPPQVGAAVTGGGLSPNKGGSTGTATHTIGIPRFDSRPHGEPIDGYTLRGPAWDQVYPVDAAEEGLLVAGINFALFARVDLYEKALKPAPKMAFGYPGHVLFSKTQSGTRRLFSAPGTPQFFAGGPYAEASLVLERERLGSLEATGGRSPGFAAIVESRLQLEAIAQLRNGDELAVINGSVADCLIASGGELLLLKGPSHNSSDYRLTRLGTTLSETIAHTLFTNGLDALLAVESQKNLAEAALPITLVKRIQDASNSGQLDFRGPYGTYYREIFFHVPFLIANYLNSQQRFPAAQRWYHYLFDPTSPDVDNERVWRYREFRGLTPLDLRKALTDPGALESYRRDPFNPHAIARLRPSAYQKTIVMKYIDNLLDWGDNLFAQFTMESVSEAAMLYVMAADILGPRPPDVGDCGEGEIHPKNYQEIAKRLKGDPEILIELEHFTPGKIQMSRRKNDWLNAINAGAQSATTTIAYRSTAASTVAPASAPAPGSPNGSGFSGPPSRPLGWREIKGSYWTTTGGVDLRNLDSYGRGGGGTVGLTPSGEGGDLTSPRLRAAVGPIRPGRNPRLPPGTLAPEDYKAPGVQDLKRKAPWEGESLERPRKDWVGPTKAEPALLDPSEAVKTSLVFCIPANEELRGYWDRVEKRLFRIRNCMDISGARRQPALFDPEIDPRLLMRARKAGLSLDDVLSVTTGSVPPYRFTYLIEKARQVAATVQGLGAGLLSSLEKRDVEELSRLRSVHEQYLLKQRSRIQVWEVEAAEDALEGLRRQRQAVEYRKGYYEGLIGTGLTEWERAQQVARHTVTGTHVVEAAVATLSGVMSLVPQLGAPTAITFGGLQVGGSMDRFARGMHATAQAAEAISTSAGLEAMFHRREEDWEHQKKLADKEISNLEKQITAAEVRLEIARRSKEIHEATIKQAEEVFEFYRDKFSSFGLYTWLSTSLNRLHREAFNTALATARMAEQAYHFERQDDEATVLSDTYWDAAQAGLLAGERLLLDLQNLERRFLETNYRTLEIEQSFSLMQFAPGALLRLRQTGACEFTIPEIFFDLTYPGHYRRRIKTVRLTVPCVVGPYTNVGAELRLQASWLRQRPETGSGPSVYQAVPLRHTSCIAASMAQSDAGVFEFGFRDERYMPFEGAGAISQWKMNLPKNFAPFDYQTISDVIIRISYTAAEDSAWRASVEAQNGALQESLRQYLLNTGLPRLLSLRHELPDIWHQLLSTPVGTQVKFDLTDRHLPYLFTALKERGVGLKTSDVDILVRADSMPTVKLEVDGQAPGAWGKEADGLYAATVTNRTIQGAHTLKVTASGNLGHSGASATGALDAGKLADIYLRLVIKTDK